MSLRDRILQADDSDEEIVHVNYWGVDILVRSISAKERNLILRKSIDKDTKEVNENEMYARLVIATARDPETGELIFREKDMEGLLSKNSAAVEKVARVSARMAGIDEEDKDQMGKLSSPDTQTSTESEDSVSTWPSN